MLTEHTLINPHTIRCVYDPAKGVPQKFVVFGRHIFMLSTWAPLEHKPSMGYVWYVRD